MNFTIKSDLFTNLAVALVSGLTYIVLGILIYLIYKKQKEKPKKLKVLIVCLIGLFMFSINISFKESLIKIPILPLGVWILYFILSSKGNQEKWNRYRPFAWFGFFANFIFLLSSLFTPIVNEWIYPEHNITTYISNHNASIVISHPSAKPATLNKEKLYSQFASMKEEPIYSDVWYDESFKNTDNNVERFPYVLTGTTPKKGSGIKSIIYVERDGNGLLITCQSKQYYFRSEKSFLDFNTEGKQND